MRLGAALALLEGEQRQLGVGQRGREPLPVPARFGGRGQLLDRRLGGPVSTWATPSAASAVDRHGLPGSSSRTAVRASSTIRSTPSGQLSAVNVATAESSELLPSGSGPATVAFSAQQQAALRPDRVAGQRPDPAGGDRDRRVGDERVVVEPPSQPRTRASRLPLGRSRARPLIRRAAVRGRPGRPAHG